MCLQRAAWSKNWNRCTIPLLLFQLKQWHKIVHLGVDIWESGQSGHNIFKNFTQAASHQLYWTHLIRTTPIVHGASVSLKALSIATLNLSWITLRGRVAPGNRTTPTKWKCIGSSCLGVCWRSCYFLLHGYNRLTYNCTWVKWKKAMIHISSTIRLLCSSHSQYPEYTGFHWTEVEST
jgi:hypothetical protein